MTTKTPTAVPTMDEARQAATEAAEALLVLEAQRAAGDPAATVQRLAEANQAAYLARLALDDAERLAAQAERENAERHRADSLAAARELLAQHSVDSVGQQWAAALREMLALVDAVGARNDAIQHAGGILTAGRWPQGGVDTPGATVPGTVPGWLRLDGNAHQVVNAANVVLGLILDLAGQRGGLPCSRYTSVRALLQGRADRDSAVEAIEDAGRNTP